MQLTKGQKDALVRKALDIVNKKREDKKSDLVAHWKPNNEMKKLLSDVAEIQTLALKLSDAFKKAGFSHQYSGWGKEIDGYTVNVSVYDIKDGTGIYDQVENRLRDCCVEDILMKETNYPDEFSILDEIELLNLSKDFKLDEFLAKYNAL